MRVGTNEIITITMPMEISLLSELYVTFTTGTGKIILEKSMADNPTQFAASGTVLTLSLDQNDTLLFKGYDEASFEVTVKYSANDAVDKSDIQSLTVYESLKTEAI